MMFRKSWAKPVLNKSSIRSGRFRDELSSNQVRALDRLLAGATEAREDREKESRG